jgi:hypothetical protein
LAAGDVAAAERSQKDQLFFLCRARHKKKNWLFAWTEIGAERIGVIQSLLVTCRLQGVDPYTYLVDVLQRIGVHPASRVIELTPREWKARFASNPMTSDLALAQQ